MNSADTPQHRQADLKRRVAGTLKWNLIDRFGSQLLYAVTGIVLANLLSKVDFGLVGAVLVFQGFAAMLVDSGFSSALIQRKAPTDDDYSTVFWFNMVVSAMLYLALAACAEPIARLFEGDMRLVALLRMMMLALIINAASIVQANRMMKRLDVKMIAVANCLGLGAGAVTGIWLAVAGYGAWAVVWQTLVLAVVKTSVLWITGGWKPRMRFSWRILASFFKVGSGVMASSALNTLFQNVYGFFIGNRAGLAPLGLFTQADKWSKMGVMSLSQTFTSSFLPVLSRVQDDIRAFAAAAAKMDRMAAWLAFPALGLLMLVAEPLFQALFGTKWDGAVALFQLLLLRGAFTVMTLQNNNCILAMGRARKLVWTEALRDAVALAAIVITLPAITLGRSADVEAGLSLFLWGQVAASAVAWAVTLVVAARLSGRTVMQLLTAPLPYLLAAVVAVAAAWPISMAVANPWLLMALQIVAGVAVYLAINAAAGSVIQHDAILYLKGKL